MRRRLMDIMIGLPDEEWDCVTDDKLNKILDDLADLRDLIQPRLDEVAQRHNIKFIVE